MAMERALVRYEKLLALQANTFELRRALTDIHTRGDLACVFVLEDGARHERQVNLGIETPTRVEVTSGLSEEEVVITL